MDEAKRGSVSGIQRLTCQQCKLPFEQGTGRPAKRCKACRVTKGKKRPTFTIPIRCPMCESPVVLINKRSLKSEMVAQVRCDGEINGSQSCRYEFLVRAYIAPVSRTEDFEPSRCGTNAGYQRHMRAGEKACTPCMNATVDIAAARDAKRRANA